MENYYFQNTTRSITVAFLEMFNSMTVKRYKGGSVVRTIYVPLKFMPPEKIVSRINASAVEPGDGVPETELFLPMMSVMLTGLEYDSARAMGKNEKRMIEIVYDDGGSIESSKMDYTPTPYTFTYELHMWTKLATDLFQLKENILPYFNPKATLTVKEQGLQLERDMKVTLTGVNLNLPEELEPTDLRYFQDSLNFTLEGYLYKPISVSGIILKIIIPVRVWSGDSLYDGGEVITIEGEELESGEITITETMEDYTTWAAS